MTASADGEREAGRQTVAPGRDDRRDHVERGDQGDRGDPACWAYRVCQRCGQFSEEERPRTCQSCGAAFPVS